MDKYNLKFTLPESVLKTQAMLDKLQLKDSALVMSEAWKTAVPNYDFSGAYTAMGILAERLSGLSKITFQTDALVGFADKLRELPMDKIQSAAASIFSQIDITAWSALKESTGLAALAKADWSWLSEEYEEKAEDIQERASEEMSSDVCNQIAADITEMLTDPENMHTTAKKKFLEWIKESPANAILFLTVLCTLIQTITGVFSFGMQVWKAQPVKDSKVYEEPKSTSSIVYNVSVENNITVIGDVPYYYEVEFPNPDTGEMVIGYIYKKNLVNVEATETEEFTNPEDNGTEAKEDITSITDESEGQAAQKD